MPDAFRSARHEHLALVYPSEPPTWTAPTVRKFHRNSTLAFPKSAEYGAAIEKPREVRWHLRELVLFAAALALFFGALYVLPRVWP